MMNNEKTTKHIVVILSIILTIFIISFVLEDKTSYEYTSTFEEQPAVYVTEYGNYYHSVDCHYLNQSKIEKGLYEVKAKGYRECSYCEGYSNSVIQVELIKYYEATYYTNAFLFSCLRAVLVTPIIYIILLKLSKMQTNVFKKTYFCPK